MPIYDRPTKSFMADWAKANLGPNQTFSKSDVLPWFAEHYPKIKRNTVGMHVEGMSINNPVRKHHPSIKPGSGYDLFYKLGPDRYRLWNPESDGRPLYKVDMEKEDSSAPPDEELVESDEASGEFAYERDLQNYLVKNLSRVEPGLRLYEEEDIAGLEFPAGGRFIDILAVDNQGSYVVIELKVSRGYDRVIGQLLRYMAWVEQNMGSAKPVRGIIVAKEITDDLKLAASRISGVRLIEYEVASSLVAVEVVNMNGNRYYGVRVEGAKYGVGFGSALAIAISYTANHSILWAIIHGILGWLYVIYFALFRSS